MGDLFGTSQRPGITDASSPVEFQTKKKEFYLNILLMYGNMGNQLTEYFKKNKSALSEKLASHNWW